MKRILFCAICALPLLFGCSPKEPAPTVFDMDGDYIFRLDGKQIKTLDQWEARRQQIYDHFADHIYGRMPEGEVQQEFIEKSVDTWFDGKATIKTVDMVFTRDTVRRVVPIMVWIPTDSLNAGKKVPVFIGWPNPEVLINEGYGAITLLDGSSIYIDAKYDAARNNQGKSLLALWGLQTDADCQPNTGQMFACQSWTFSREIDYIETQDCFDTSKIAIAGCSRGGKDAAWTGASDERIALVAISQSGAGGLGLTQYKAEGAEPISNLANMFPHWFCPDFYVNYDTEEKHTEYDQDALCALIAPRLLYDCVSYEYPWGNPTGEFLGVRNGSRAWELYGYEGLNATYPPTVCTPIMNRVGFHVRLGGHAMSADYDWPQILAFAHKWWD